MKANQMVLSLPDSVSDLLTALQGAGFEAYAVGGCIRDALLGTAPHDWDICTSALPEQMEAVFSEYRLLKTGLKHGTVTVLVNHVPYEITTFRTETGYSDHRRPDRVVFVKSLEQDLSRRDFTINAMACGLNGGLVDLFGGTEDLFLGLIRCVGDPDRRFSEDGLRILRALRFAARLGFQIEPNTARSIHENRGLLCYISGERIFSELKGLLAGKDAEMLLREFPDVIGACLPALQRTIGLRPESWNQACRAVSLAPMDDALRLTLLLETAGGTTSEPAALSELLQGATECLNRLKCDNRTRKTVLELLELSRTSIPTDRVALRHCISRWSPDRVRQAVCLNRVRCLSLEPGEIPARQIQTEALLEAILSSETCFTIQDLAITGKDLIALGIPAGTQVGETLRTLLNLVLEERLLNESAALLSWAASYWNQKREERCGA